MVFLLLVSVLFVDPLLSFNWWAGEELKWRQLAHHHLMNQQGLHFSPHSKVKANDKSTNLRKYGIQLYKSHSVHFSVLGQNPSEEELDYENNNYNRKPFTSK